jgi:hypothetical protein
LAIRPTPLAKPEWLDKRIDRESPTHAMKERCNLVTKLLR